MSWRVAICSITASLLTRSLTSIKYEEVVATCTIVCFGYHASTVFTQPWKFGRDFRHPNIVSYCLYFWLNHFVICCLKTGCVGSQFASFGYLLFGNNKIADRTVSFWLPRLRRAVSILWQWDVDLFHGRKSSWFLQYSYLFFGWS